MAKKKATTKATKASKATKTAKKAAPKKTTARKKASELDQLNETGKRKSNDRRKKKSPAEAKAAAPKVERRKVQRRRQIDPTTCERDYNNLEIEFMHALDEYKRASGRMFPTCSEILEVIMKLGYRKVDLATELADQTAAPSDSTSSECDIIDPVEQIDETFDSIEQLSM